VYLHINNVLVIERTVADENVTSEGQHSVGENDHDVFEEQRYVMFDIAY
jgi:hypothetical protein